MIPYAPWIVWTVPIIIAFIHPLLEKISGKLRDFMAIFAVFISAVSAASMIPDVIKGSVVINGVEYHIPYDWKLEGWLPLPTGSIEVGMLIDPLSVFMANIVGWIGLLIMIYSIEYMHGDESITRYWMLMNLFIGFMQLLVLADNFLIMFFGWEGVGFASYALIGYYYKDEKKYWIGPYSPTHAGMKAFIMTRIGDVGLLVSIVVIYIYSGTTNFLALSSNFGWMGNLARDGLLAITLLLLFLGPVGKSAQFPLHEWLPEAMAGPTTVSALIHAATMVKAGVYLVARVTPILYLGYASLGELIYPSLNTFFITVAWIGGFTAFLAASMGMVSDQIKKVLAYSTVSQLGYMISIIGVAGLLIESEKLFFEGYIAGISHLYSHAVFKALLFLSAGAVGHAIGSYMLRDAGGLKKYLPRTYLVMFIGLAALSGIPPLNGFFSKDGILHLLYAEHMWPLFILLSLTAILTVFYSFRLLGLIFYGERENLEHGHDTHLHDPGPFMMIPLLILAGASVVGGFLLPNLHGFFEFWAVEGLGIHIEKITLQSFLTSTFTSPILLVSLGIIIVGIYPAYSIYIRGALSAEELLEKYSVLRGIWRFLFERWYINAIYYKVFVDGTRFFSEILFKFIECNGAGQKIKSFYSSLAEEFRYIQTGYYRINMIYVLLGLLMIIILALILGV
jgi:NADH-quinone oxidoreductase subunit L